MKVCKIGKNFFIAEISKKFLQPKFQTKVLALFSTILRNNLNSIIRNCYVKEKKLACVISLYYNAGRKSTFFSKTFNFVIQKSRQEKASRV